MKTLMLLQIILQPSNRNITRLFTLDKEVVLGGTGATSEDGNFTKTFGSYSKAKIFLDRFAIRAKDCNLLNRF